MSDTNRSDALLWESFRNGSSEALATLFRRFYEPLVLYGHKLSQDRELVEDCIQELFTELWQFKNTPIVSFVRAYLFKSLKYKIFRVLEKRRAEQISGRQVEYLFEFNPNDLQVLQYQDEMKKKKLIAILQQLSARQREIVYLKFYQGLSYDEISQVMEINYQAARNLLYKSVQSLRKLAAADNWELHIVK